MMKFKKTLALLLSVCTIVSFSACSNEAKKAPEEADETQVETNETTEEQSLFIYCGAGLKKPMEKIAKLYEEENGVKIEYTYAGSAQLISQLELSGKGDLFIIGSETVYKKAIEKGLAGEYELVAHHTPVIGVQKGNPLGIEKLSDLANEGVKVILGDKEANAIGKSADQIIKNNGLEDILNNVIATPSTINEIFTALNAKECDAAIITKDSAFGKENVEIIEIPEDQNIDQLIPIGTVTATEKEETAKDFMNFVISDKGKEIFGEFGFEPYVNK